VVTLENDAGTVSSSSSISIPNNKITIPQPTAPIVETQIASSTSISVKIRVPSISGFDGSKMVAKLNVVSAPNCTNLSVNPGSTYDCAGLSANATYTANVSVSSSTGQLVTNTSSNVSFTTIGLGSSLYVCGQSCTGTLTNSVMQYYISDKRAIEANAESGGPITSSTCTGSGCNPGTSPALPVACSTGSYERTNITANATAQITTHFRYCSAPTDTTPPAISSGTLALTGYAPIIPTSGAAGASISVRFIATDNIGIANTSIRLINPGNVVVASSSGSFIAGGVSNGVYSATIATASSGPLGGDVYQIQVQASDGSGNSSSWFNLGTYTISSQVLLPTFSSVTSTTGGFTFQITNYNSAYTWSTYVEATSQPGAGATISSSGLVTVSGMTSGTSATITVRTSRTGYESGTNLIAGTALNSTSNQLKIIATGPDSDGITNIGICFTNPSVLSGTVTYNINGASSGSFLKHSGTPACPSYASGSSGLRLTPDTTYNYSATASNNGINYSATLSFRTPAATTLPGLTPSFGARVADTYSGGFKYQITNYDPSYTWAVTATSGSASISSSGLLSVISVPAKQSATLTVTTRKTGYNSGSASITSVSPWNLSTEIQTQNITATLSGSALTVNVPDAKDWTWTLIWDGYVQKTGITSFPYIVNGFSTNKNIQLAALDNLQNYGYSRVFLPTVSAPTVVTPEVIFNSGTFTSGVLAGSIAPGGSFGISWRVINTDQISSTVALIDSNGNSASWVGGALVSGTVQNGTYQGSLSVPAGFATGRYLICAQATSSTNGRSASQCGNRSEYVKVAELQVNTAPVISPSKYSGTDAYSGIVAPGRGQFWESGFQNAVSVSVVASSPGEASIVAPFSSSWGGTVVIAVADGMSVGQKLYKAAIYVPVGTPTNKLFTLTWTATSATGQTLVVTEGSFNTGP
jgi:hypothetical protein